MSRRWPAALVLVGLIAVLAGGLFAYVGSTHQRMYSVRTGSMMPSLQPGDAVVDRPLSRPYRVGDVVTFHPSLRSAAVVTHRIVSVKGSAITTKGDGNRTPDSWTISSAQIVGAVAHRVPRGGYVLVYFQQRNGIASAMTAALALALLWGLFFPGASTTEGDTYPAENEPKNRGICSRRRLRTVILTVVRVAKR